MWLRVSTTWPDCSATNRLAEAESLYERALTIREKMLGAEHPTVATSLNDLALLYYDQGQYGKAESFSQRAVAIQEKVFGPEDPEVAECLNSLALLYYHQGQYEKTEPLFGRALAIREKTLDPEHIWPTHGMCRVR
jgi:tetratricopeptide (TPR) repeat protein